MDVEFRLFEDYSASNLNFRKYHHMRHARESVAEHGSLAIYNTGADETAHKEGPKVRGLIRGLIRPFLCTSESVSSWISLGQQEQAEGR